MSLLDDLRIRIFADGADPSAFAALAADPIVQGFTTNPTLMRAAGIEDYERFARDVLSAIGGKPVSFEVFADEADEMEAQAREIASWGSNVFVKLPVSDTRGGPTYELLRRLAVAGVRLNVTAVMTHDQIKASAEAIAPSGHGLISVFAGRIADTGRDPVPHMAHAVELLRPFPGIELLWASPRELLNLFHADAVGCHVITMTPELLRKLPLLGKDLAAYSLETVRMFHDDAAKAAYRIRAGAGSTG